MDVKLLHNTPLWVAAKAIRTAWDSHEKSDSVENVWACLDCKSVFTKNPIDPDTGCSVCPNCGSPDVYYEKVIIGTKDIELIDRVGNKFKHSSTLEHLFYNFEINGISRACLQEVVRHRIASYTVKSTRYTLKELKQEAPFNNFDDPKDFERAEKYLVWTGNKEVDSISFMHLDDLRLLITQGIPNDLAKFSLPESYKTGLVMSINARSLQNFLKLRTDKSAMWEIRKLAYAIYEALPSDHKYLFEGCLYEKR